MTFGLILVALAVLAGLAYAAIRAHDEEYLLVLQVHGAGTFFFERLDNGHYDRIAEWQLPAAAFRYALRTRIVLRRPTLRTPSPVLARH